METLPQHVTQLAQSIAAHGGRAMLVGGCVRDFLLGLAPKDLDIEVYGLEPPKLYQILRSLGKVNTVGESFQVYKIASNIDVSLPRRERKVAKGHRGFVVEGDPHMSFQEACLRRDFTINAMLQDLVTGEIIDCFHGQDDLKIGLLRHIDDATFQEDSLRVLRAAQLASRFQFRIDPQTVALCQSIDLSDIASERIWIEFEKLLMLSPRPSLGIRYLYELRVMEKLFPELNALIGVPQDPKHHPEGDVDIHTMMVVDEARKIIHDLDYPQQITIMLAALCHDLGKPHTTAFKDGQWRSHAHDVHGTAPTESLLDRLNVFTIQNYDVRQNVLQLVRHHLAPLMFYHQPPKDGAFRRLARKVNLDLLVRLSRADSLGRHDPKGLVLPNTQAQDWFLNKIQNLNVQHKPLDPLLQGRDLITMGYTPSVRFGEVLDAIYEMQLDGHITTHEQAQEYAREFFEKKNNLQQ